MLRTFKTNTNITRVVREEGETIEQMLRRLVANKEPIPQNVAEIFTPKDDGVLPQYDIRADRQEIALKALDKIQASRVMESTNKPEVSQQETKDE